LNKHIELIKKWLNDKDSVATEELKQNSEAAQALAFAAQATSIAYAAPNSEGFELATERVAHWVERYEELAK
tara:strand:+ start:3360 stop:3575 length:216 start_codon:yes stop_codon:yes gene_type:complete